MDIRLLSTVVLLRAYRLPLFCMGAAIVCLFACVLTPQMSLIKTRWGKVALRVEIGAVVVALLMAVFLAFLTLLASDGMDRSVMLKKSFTTEDATYPAGTVVTLNSNLDRISGATLAKPTMIAGYPFVGELGIIDNPQASRRFHGTLSRAVDVHQIPCGPGDATIEAAGAFVECQLDRVFPYAQYGGSNPVLGVDVLCAPGPASFSQTDMSCVLAAPATVSGASLKRGDRVSVDTAGIATFSWTAHDVVRLFENDFPSETKVEVHGRVDNLTELPVDAIPSGVEVRVSVSSEGLFRVQDQEVAGPAQFTFSQKATTAVVTKPGRELTSANRLVQLRGTHQAGRWSWVEARVNHVEAP